MGAPARATAVLHSVDAYFALVEQGELRADDRVELLEGVIVAMAPQNPPHSSATANAHEALALAIGPRAAIRGQLPIVLGGRSVPEPDIAVVPGRNVDYASSHPTTALLIVEVADSSLVQDRLSKAAIYASAGIPEYWIVNLRDGVVEVLRSPDTASARYADRRVAVRGEVLHLVAFPDARVSTDDLLPR